MGRPASTRQCKLCGQPGVKRNGTTSAGKVRWRCTGCGASSVQRRTDHKDLATFEQFLAWVSGKDTQGQCDATATGRSFRRHIAWCWDVPVPRPPVTGEIHDQVFIDGTYLAHGWCLLVARNNTGTIVAWQWCSSENSAAYTQLLSMIPAPTLVTTDGHGGALKALKECWPTTAVQRCLLHVHRNNTRDLTRRPKTMAGRALIALSKQLLDITSIDQATSWAVQLANFHTHYADYLRERTYARDDPATAASKGKKPTSWWYTHERDRRVYHRLNRLYQSGHLFAYLTTSTHPLERTTNPVESINHQIKQVIKHHPGLSHDHLTCAIEWVLYTYTDNRDTPRRVLNNWHGAGKPIRRLIPEKPRQSRTSRPQEYDTALTSEEGLWTRTGWAGRSF